MSVTLHECAPEDASIVLAGSVIEAMHAKVSNLGPSELFTGRDPGALGFRKKLEEQGAMCIKLDCVSGDLANLEWITRVKKCARALHHDQAIKSAKLGLPIKGMSREKELKPEKIPETTLSDYLLGKERDFQLFEKSHTSSTLAPEREKGFWDLVDARSTFETEYIYAISPSEISEDGVRRMAPSVAHPWAPCNFADLKGSVLLPTVRIITGYERMFGVTDPWVYLSCIFSTFSSHSEDFQYASANVNLARQGSAAYNIWLSVPRADYGNMHELLFAKMGSAYTIDCLEKRTVFPDPRDIAAWNASHKDKQIRVYRHVQGPGEYVVTDYGSVHWGVNLGTGWKAAVNFAYPGWQTAMLEIDGALKILEAKHNDTRHPRSTPRDPAKFTDEFIQTLVKADGARGPVAKIRPNTETASGGAYGGASDTATASAAAPAYAISPSTAAAIQKMRQYSDNVLWARQLCLSGADDDTLRAARARVEQTVQDRILAATRAYEDEVSEAKSDGDKILEILDEAAARAKLAADVESAAVAAAAALADAERSAREEDARIAQAEADRADRAAKADAERVELEEAARVNRERLAEARRTAELAAAERAKLLEMSRETPSPAPPMPTLGVSDILRFRGAQVRERHRAKGGSGAEAGHAPERADAKRADAERAAFDASSGYIDLDSYSDYGTPEPAVPSPPQTEDAAGKRKRNCFHVFFPKAVQCPDSDEANQARRSSEALGAAHVCPICETDKSPLWRRTVFGPDKVYYCCNACSVNWKKFKGSMTESTWVQKRRRAV